MLESISDTALLAAAARAREARRTRPLVVDPLARRLAGARGARLAAALPFSRQLVTPIAIRTRLIDRFILHEVRHGSDLVVNLAAGLDTRPYRLPLPRRLRWVEVDLPTVIRSKSCRLLRETPTCRVRRVEFDLADRPARRQVLRQMAETARAPLALTEGFLVYLHPSEAATLATDLAHAGFVRWVLDLPTPAAGDALRKRFRNSLAAAGIVVRFAPAAGPNFFRRQGWEPLRVRSALRAGVRLGRYRRTFARWAARGGHDSYVCLLGRGPR